MEQEPAVASTRQLTIITPLLCTSQAATALLQHMKHKIRKAKDKKQGLYHIRQISLSCGFWNLI